MRITGFSSRLTQEEHQEFRRILTFFPPSDSQLAAANSATIPSCHLRLTLGGQAFDHMFLLAITKYSILA
jgi:hypothetical protein